MFSDNNMMTNKEKIEAIYHLINNPGDVELYYNLLEKMDDFNFNYNDFMETAPINGNVELKRLPEADYELCTALLIMILREDHFSNGSFEKRLRDGSVNDILNRMV